MQDFMQGVVMSTEGNGQNSTETTEKTDKAENTVKASGTQNSAPAHDGVEVVVDTQEDVEEMVADINYQEAYQAQQQEIANYKKEIEELTGRLRSVSAAYQNKSNEVKEAKERLERQIQAREARNRGDVVSSIFAPFENLKRSITSFQRADLPVEHMQGLEMVRDQFWAAFTKMGLEEVPGNGSLFNPDIHEALTTMPVTDPVLHNTVTTVYESGYRINGIVIKNAKVVVGMYVAPQVEKPTEEAKTEQVAVETTPKQDDDTI